MATRKETKAVNPHKTERALERYRSKRDFHVTSEPRGGQEKKADQKNAAVLPFVVQKHAATRLHYDFRLAWRGVLKSWAVAKGPSYYPGDRRLAIQVEDHPLEYGDFEGTIPKGQYGGGAVMVWDTGTWAPLGDAEQGFNEGHIKFELRGKKLKGRWALVRMQGRAANPGKPSWLLIKEKDSFARDREEEQITEEAPNSAVTGRTIDQIGASADRVWNSSRNGGRSTSSPTSARSAPSQAAAGVRKRTSHKDLERLLRDAKREKLPGFISPQLAQLSSTPPAGGGWLHELKLDGYRIQIHIETKKRQKETKRNARLLTRKGLDWSDRMPDIARAAAALDVTSAILDGEAVALDENGISNFADLQAAFQEGRQRYITYFGFDILHLDGYNLRELPMAERKRILEALLKGMEQDTPIRFSEGFEADGGEVFKKACVLGAEGIISKPISAKYVSGRGHGWLKLKCHLEQELVIGGFTLPSKGGIGIGALLLGYYAGKELHYAGRCGTGYTQKTHRALRARLKRITQKNSPFEGIPREAKRDAIWVKPELVAQISFATWTRDNLVRQASFKGLREDKAPREVRQENPSAPNLTDPAASEPEGKRKSKMQPTKNASGKGGVKMAGFQVTHPEKILDAESDVTKQELAEYYVGVAEHLLPNIANRPLSVVRCPEGSSKPCFFQKHVGIGLPAGVKSVPIRSRKTGEKDDFLTVDSVEGLVGLAQMGVLEIHPWGSQNNSLEKPDRIVFDLDPDTAINWRVLADTAVELRKRLKRMKLDSFLKSTGGKGLHVVIPIEPEYEWPVIKDFAHKLVLELESERPDLYVTKMTKASRTNRIYLDYLRNDRGATSVAAYSSRARSGLPVAMPLQWRELDGERVPVFHVSDFQEWQSRLARDPWTALFKTKQKLAGELVTESASQPRRRAKRLTGAR